MTAQSYLRVRCVRRMLADPIVDRALDTAREAVAAAGDAALRWFRNRPAATRKADQSPVSQADHDANRAILDVILGAFPDHDLLSEETGPHGPGTCDCRWLVDPIDGTRDFLRGDLGWGPMVALERAGQLQVAAMATPATGETWWASRGHGAWRNGERVHVSSVATWTEARVVFGYLRGLLREPFGRAVLDLLTSADQVRCPGNLAGCALVLDGRAEVWLEAGVHEWDLAAPRLLIEEAGGRFTDFLGRPSHSMGMGVATNRTLHDLVLAALAAR